MQISDDLTPCADLCTQFLLVQLGYSWIFRLIFACVEKIIANITRKLIKYILISNYGLHMQKFNILKRNSVQEEKIYNFNKKNQEDCICIKIAPLFTSYTYTHSYALMPTSQSYVRLLCLQT